MSAEPVATNLDYADPDVRILHGDALDRLAELPDESVQCIITSPPFWGLRDYGVDGQIGLEETPDEWCSRLVAVFRECRRVLRDDGTLWVEVGDSYAATTRGAGGDGKQHTNAGSVIADRTWHVPDGLKPKDLVGAPWMLAFALRAEGWFLRSENIWARPNPMPESVTDRPTKAHSTVFLLTKRGRYYYDADAIREPLAPVSEGRYAYAFGGAKNEALSQADKDGVGAHTRPVGMRELTAGANARTVWSIATEPTPFAHFATFPQSLVEKCLKAGTKEGDVVLDPFMGSGTVAIVARRLGRHAIGVELNAEYIAIAARRLAQQSLLA